MEITVNERTYNNVDDTPEKTMLVPTDNKLIGFTRRADLLAWAENNGVSELVSKCDMSLRKIRRQYPEPPSSRVLEQIRIDQVSMVKAARRKLLAELKARGGNLNDPASLKRLVTNIDPFRGSPLHSVVLYQFTGYRGRNLFLPGSLAASVITYPDLDWFGRDFDNRTSSCLVIGAAVLCQYTWFRGRTLWLVGVPWKRFTDLGIFDFDNRTSSALVY